MVIPYDLGNEHIMGELYEINDNFRYSDDGALTYVLCEDNSPLAEPQPVEDCCACNEAKYEMIFEGIWSRHTHPKDFPR